MKGVKKQDLPFKLCTVCNRPFTWRKKWEKNWEQVLYCSDRCRMNKQKTNEHKESTPSYYGRPVKQ